MNNFCNIFVARRRWLKKRVSHLLSDVAWVDLGDNFKMYLDPKDLRGPSFHLAYGLSAGFDNYEKAEKDALAELLPADGVFFDIGANIGLFTYYLKKRLPEIKVHSFEPHPDLSKCIQLTRDENKFSGVNVHQIGLGNESGEFKLYLSNLNAGGHSLFVNSPDKCNESFVNVKVETLDGFCKSNSVGRIDVIKIDVEGNEQSVLDGAIDVLREHKPSMLIECSNEELAEGKEVIEFFSKNEFNVNCKLIGDNEFCSLSELSAVAKSRFDKGVPLDNYIFKIV